MKTRAFLVGIIILFLYLAGCARTKVAGVWINEEYTGPPVGSLVILAQVEDSYNRSAWENNIAERYRKSGMEAVPAATIFPESKSSRLDLVLARAREEGIEGVLMVRHVDTRTLKKYHPPEAEFYHVPRYYPYWRYYPYRHHYPWYYYPPFPYYYYEGEYLIRPGYTTYHKVVLIESYLYVVGSRKQVWSMSTETFDPISPNHLAGDIGRSSFKMLRRYDLIRLAR